jgi:ribosome-binding ATPase YchF (GTP1/OBG family)
MNIAQRGLDRLIAAGYKLLGLRTFFTVGPKEIRAWTVRAGAKAPEAAGRIHSDFEKGFIRAETYHYHDLLQKQSEKAVKDAGLLRMEGKDYEVKDGDIFHFHFA